LKSDISKTLTRSIAKVSPGYKGLGEKVSIEHYYEIIRNLSNGTTVNDLELPLTRISRSRHFLKSCIRKTARLKDEVTAAQEETTRNIWNSTMLGDLD